MPQSVLHIGGVSATELAKRFKTPLYVYDQQKIEEIIETFKQNFVSEKFETKIIYASKAFQAIEMLNLVADNGFGLDIVSGGELYAALQSRMQPEDIYFHGNNKTMEELNLAFIAGMKHIIVDNFMELEAIGKLATIYQQQMEVSLRLNVGVEAHTHEYIVTSHIDSKFGMAYESDECQRCLDFVSSHPYLMLEGIHSHIGSQIFDTVAWYTSIDILIGYLKDFPAPLTLNIGGGFGIRYTEQDTPHPISDILTGLVSHVEKGLDAAGISINKLIIEPGRSLVGEAGSTLYTVGYQKETPGKKYYFVDGGMGDNMRPSLYQALYRCDLANKMDLEKTEKVTVAGKYCESGDILIHDAMLPKAEQGDLLVVYTTGAYGYSMSSMYNRNAIPGVVFCKDGIAKEVIKRQSYDDMIANEIFKRQSKIDLPKFDQLKIPEVAVHEG